MPCKAMSQYSDSQNPSAPEMPLYAIVENGQFYLLDVEDTPCPTLTPAGRAETRDGALEETADRLIAYLRRHRFEAGFLIELIEEAAAARQDNSKSLNDCYAAYAQIFLQLDHCITRSQE